MRYSVNSRLLLPAALWLPALLACLSAAPARGQAPERDASLPQMRIELNLVRDTMKTERARYSQMQRDLKRQQQEIAALTAELKTAGARADRLEREAGRVWFGLGALLVLTLLAIGAAVLRRLPVRPAPAALEGTHTPGPLQEQVRAAEARLRALEREVGAG